MNITLQMEAISMDKKLLLAAAFSGLTLTSTAIHAEETNTKTVMCYGVNACKGHGACAGKVDACSGKNGCEAKTSCAGHNSCKGKGFTKMSEKDCKDKGGKVSL